MATDGDDSKLQSYEKKTSGLMTGLAFAFLFVYSVPIIWTSSPKWVNDVLSLLNVAIWAVFVVDLITRALLSRRPVRYLVRHPIDLLLVLLPMLRPLRVLRVFTAMQVLLREGGRLSLGGTMAGAAAAALILMFIAAVAMLDSERGDPDALIRTFPDAVWWSAATVTTVGYGDMYPVTWVGRWVAFTLMIVGISLIGVVTASIAAWFVGHAQEVEADLTAEIRALRSEVAQLREDRQSSG